MHPPSGAIPSLTLPHYGPYVGNSQVPRGLLARLSRALGRATRRDPVPGSGQAAEVACRLDSGVALVTCQRPGVHHCETEPLYPQKSRPRTAARRYADTVAALGASTGRRYRERSHPRRGSRATDVHLPADGPWVCGPVDTGCADGGRRLCSRSGGCVAGRLGTSPPSGPRAGLARGTTGPSGQPSVIHGPRRRCAGIHCNRAGSIDRCPLGCYAGNSRTAASAGVLLPARKEDRTTPALPMGCSEWRADEQDRTHR